LDEILIIVDWIIPVLDAIFLVDRPDWRREMMVWYLSEGMGCIV